ncbi:MAG: GFA family protein [Paracoccaceae bacterium]|nr:GFA family protein [Paracoccaceae bacterium]
MGEVTGQCMCGAVTVTAVPVPGTLGACHCDMCRRWSSGAFIAFEAEMGSVKVEGPARTITTSDWAERAFCTECGSPLWYRITMEGSVQRQTHLAAGLFENAAGLDLGLEVYIDKKPEGYAFAGERKRMTEAEVIAEYAPPEAGGQP